MIPRQTGKRSSSSSKTQLLRFIENSGDSVIAELDERIVAVSPAFLSLYRYPTAEELLGRPVAILHAEADHARIQDIKRRQLSGSQAPAMFEFQGKRQDGSLIDLEAFTSLSQAGSETLLVTVVRDAGERRKPAQKMGDCEWQLRAVGEGLREAILILDLEDRVQFANRQALVLTGLSFEEIAGQQVFEVFLPRHEWKTLVQRNQLSLPCISAPHPILLRRKDRSSCWAELTTTPYRGADGALLGTLVAMTDVTERKQNEECMKFQAEVLSRVTDAIVAVDKAGLVSYWNRGAEKLYGFKFYQALGRPLKELIDYDCRQMAQAGEAPGVLPSSGAWHEESTHRGSKGEAISVELSISRLQDVAGHGGGYLAVIRDITERRQNAEILKQKEEQLRQSQKMEAIGKLAGGVAHDFNNLLTAISGYSEMLLNRLERSHPMRGDVEEIKKAGNRAAELTRQLLAFSRKQVVMPQVLDLNAVVLGMDKMLRRLIGAHIELVTVLEPVLAPIKADRGQIEQVILNLAVNARDAMASGGKLAIETMNAEGLPAVLQKGCENESQNWVMLAVSDTGCGMDAETQARIFEPFYTTKKQGEGTGLGLSTVYGIVQQSGGQIQVESQPQGGTTFRIYLPQVLVANETASPNLSALELPAGTETILLVEDEAVVRKLVHQILKRSGYQVLEAQHGAEALRLAIQHEGPIHLLLTDIVMPLMGGREVARRLHEFRKETKVLFMSGYTDDEAIRQGVLEPSTALIQKPFAPDSLSRKVREVLDRG